MKRATIFLILAALLLSAGSALAMSSPNYRMDWFIPVTGSGGVANSVNYAAASTVGQIVIGDSASGQYTAGFGYWNGVPYLWRNFLPILMKN
jgi:hypothetical protein